MASGLTHLQAYVDALPMGEPLPVERWNPPFCGDIDLRITHDGVWFYNGTPIQRAAMVQLFARVLRKEGDAYFLVTPVEKLGIIVEDVPFIAVEMTVGKGEAGQTLTFRTNMGDTVTADAGHAWRFETGDDGFKPYIEVRRGLFARLSRSVAQELAALGHVKDHEGEPWFGVMASGAFVPIARADPVSGEPV